MLALGLAQRAPPTGAVRPSGLASRTDEVVRTERSQPGSCVLENHKESDMSVKEPLITTSPGRLSGTPVFAGTRVPVQTLIDYLEAGDSLESFLDDFPSVSREHAVAVLELAKSALLAKAVAA